MFTYSISISNYQSRREERKWRCVIEQIEIDKNTTANPAFLRFAIGGMFNIKKSNLLS